MKTITSYKNLLHSDRRFQNSMNEITNNKKQISNKFQNPILKLPGIIYDHVIGICVLEFIWNLGFGIWNLGYRIWDLSPEEIGGTL